MRLGKVILAVSALAAVAVAATGSDAAKPKAAPRPHVLVIVADDLGYSDLGAFGGEIATPNLDALAAHGMKLTGFHAAPTCSPTRAMLMTGADNHLVGMGTMSEFLTDEQRKNQGYQGALTARYQALPAMMAKAGYRTLMSGKWHLGEKDDESPTARGFERSFALLQGGHNHWGQDGAMAKNYLGSATYREDGKIVPTPQPFYSSDYFADRMVQFLKEKPADKRPVFAYLAFTAPHWPLHAPQAEIDKYKGKYDAGPAALREERLKRMKALGLIPQNVAAHPMVADKAWDKLSPEQRAIKAREMEVYAAMVDRMDQDIGKVLFALKDTGRLDNTVIIFLSDNGSEGNDVVQQPEHPDNSLDNIGKPSSYIGYGSSWAQASTAPSFLYKAYTTEGGSHTPAIIAGPGVPAGKTSSAWLGVMDIAPTVLNLAGTSYESAYHGREMPAVHGLSWTPWLKGRSPVVHGPDEIIASELFYGRSVQQGTWKAVWLSPIAMRLDPSLPAQKWLLFDIAKDPGETTDVAAQHPDKLKALSAAWDDYAAKVGVIRDPPGF